MVHDLSVAGGTRPRTGGAAVRIGPGAGDLSDPGDVGLALVESDEVDFDDRSVMTVVGAVTMGAVRERGPGRSVGGPIVTGRRAMQPADVDRA
jgi:hypothetical protein